jgi:uncharacterized membrane protein
MADPDRRERTPDAAVDGEPAGTEIVDPSATIDRLLPGPGSPLDRFSQAVQAALADVAETPVGRPLIRVLRGNEWLGHPAHPAVVVVPIGAWVVAGWYDLRSAVTEDPRDEHAADGALRVGVAGSVLAAATGAAQYLDTRDGARRETAVHAALNTTALALYLTSWALRRVGRRRLGRRLSGAALGIVGVSGYLGGDLSYRRGVGVRPQVLREPDRSVSTTSAEPIESSEARHT